MTKPRLRRSLLAGLASVTMGAWLGGGCAAQFDSISKVNALRVFAAAADRPCEDDPEKRCGGSYARPGDTVHFELTYFDGYVDPARPDDGPRPVQIVWIGGCFNPLGDQYFGCYDDLAALFQDAANAGGATGAGGFGGGVGEGGAGGGSGGIPGGLGELIGIGPGFDLTIPLDILSSRPVPPTGPHYGLAYVFFVACAGEIRVVPPEGTSAAGSFPIGCFDAATGKRLGPESFVPGYTQVYVFEDGRDNENPPVAGLSLDGAPIDPDVSPNVKACPITEEERRVSGCGQQDPTQECETYDIAVIADSGIAEEDPSATSSEGGTLTEAVWVDYYADAGDLGSSVKLVNDAVEGFNAENETEWIPPSTPGLVNVWAVVHDARGGATVVERTIIVE